MFKGKKLGIILALGALISSCTQNGTAIPVTNLSNSSSNIPVTALQNADNSSLDNSELSNNSSIDPKFVINTNKYDSNANSDSLNSTRVDIPVSSSTTSSVKSTVESNTTVKTQKVCSETKPAYELNIPRNKNGEPIYKEIKKGSYTGEYYKVRKGDSIYLISYLVGKTQKEIADLNKISISEKLRPGQTLLVNPRNCVEKVVETVVETVKPVKSTVPVKQPSTPIKIQKTEPVTEPNVPEVVEVKPTEIVPSEDSNNIKTSLSETKTPIQVNGKGSSNYIWPANGKIVSLFSEKQGKPKGISIAGNIGDNIYAIGDGEIIYTGSALPYYGNSIIMRSLKNNDIIIYAHLSSIKVRRLQKVSSGEIIGLMGNDGSKTTELYLEIRKNNVPQDPLKFLPPR